MAKKVGIRGLTKKAQDQGSSSAEPIEPSEYRQMMDMVNTIVEYMREMNDHIEFLGKRLEVVEERVKQLSAKPKK